MKALVLVILLAILISLSSGLYYLIQDREGSPRLFRALVIRVALSAVLILFLLVSHLAGWVVP